MDCKSLSNSHRQLVDIVFWEEFVAVSDIEGWDDYHVIMSDLIEQGWINRGRDDLLELTEEAFRTYRTFELDKLNARVDSMKPLRVEQRKAWEVNNGSDLLIQFRSAARAGYPKMDIYNL